MLALPLFLQIFFNLLHLQRPMSLMFPFSLQSAVDMDEKLFHTNHRFSSENLAWKFIKNVSDFVASYECSRTPLEKLSREKKYLHNLNFSVFLHVGIYVWQWQVLGVWCGHGPYLGGNSFNVNNLNRTPCAWLSCWKFACRFSVFQHHIFGSPWWEKFWTD